MTITCPHCHAPLDIGDAQIGQRVHHAGCRNWLLVARNAQGERYGVKVQPPPELPRKVYRDDE